MGNSNTTLNQRLCKTEAYTQGIHPGVHLLPPMDIVSYPTLPSSVLGQISFDGTYYDHYGKFGAAFEDSMIQAPTGRAKADYEKWLLRNPKVALEVDEKIRQNKAKLCGEAPEKKPEEQAVEKLNIDKIVEVLSDSQSQTVVKEPIIEPAAPVVPAKPVQPPKPAQPTVNMDKINKAREFIVIKRQIADALQARFIVHNSDRLIKFKDLMEQECKGMADLLDLDFNPMFDEQQNLFYDEMKAENLMIFTKMSQKYRDVMTDLQTQGETITEERKTQLIKQAQDESDKLSVDFFDQISQRYIQQVKDRMTDMMMGGLQNLQQMPRLNGQNSLNLQQLQNIIQPLSAQPIQIINLNDLGTQINFMPQFQPQLQNMQFLPLNI